MRKIESSPLREVSGALSSGGILGQLPNIDRLGRQVSALRLAVSGAALEGERVYLSLPQWRRLVLLLGDAERLYLASHAAFLDAAMQQRGQP